jgi:hypothetical protein
MYVCVFARQQTGNTQKWHDEGGQQLRALDAVPEKVMR